MRFSDRARRLRALFVAAALLLPGGCGELPAPFAHTPGKTSSLVEPVADGGGIVVLDVTGPPDAVAAALQRAMVDALARHDIPAATDGGNRRSRFLHGSARIAPGPAGTVRLEMTWDLADTAGSPVGSQPVAREVPREAWERADPTLIKSLADEAAPAIAALVQEPAPAEATRNHRTPLHVWPVAGVEEQDAVALRRAMEAALRRRDYTVQAELGEKGLVIAGSVVLGKAADGLRRIEVVWTVLDGGGRELGQLAQDNTIPVGNGAPALAEVANDIAEAAAGGVIELLERLPPAATGAAGSG